MQKESLSGNITEEEIFKNLNKCFENNEVSDEFGVGIVILIFKKGDRHNIANYRPIILLNTDYKLFMKILTDRIVPVLSDLISPGQSLNTDIKKAFDSVEWSFLFHVLENMNFPNNIIKILIIIYEKGTHMSKNILKIIQVFGEEVSGNLINLDISSIIHYHRNHNNMENEKHFPITNINVKFETFKYLGIHIGEHDLATEKNEKELKEKIKAAIKKIKAAKSIKKLQKEIDSVIGLTKIFNKNMFK
eukprot:Pgem_evm1s5104